MDDFEKILRDAEQEGIKVNQGLSRLLLDMWKNSRDEIRELIAKSKRLCAVAIIASALAAFSLIACLYLVTVVTEQGEEISAMQGEIDSIWSIFEEGVVQEMNLAELDRKAIEIATKALSKGSFDWQAYLVYKAAVKPVESATANADVVPESNADEGMAEVIALFAQYAACKRGKVSEAETLKALEAVTDRLRLVIVEMYHLCGSEKERQIVRELKSKLP